MACLFKAAVEPIDPNPGEGTQESTALPVDARVLGSYVLLEEIGRGGQGIIFRAIHQDTREIVAVKTVLPEDAGCAETITRFKREAEAAQSLDHPNSMPIFQVGTSVEGVPFFGMKWARGGSLHHLKSKYQGRWHQIAELLIKICQAVHHAHRRGIVHRDIKPGNILFTEDQEPLVTDFGLAKQLDDSSDLTQAYEIFGTPNYVSPEQASGNTRDLTIASDIYSLGAVLYELLTGRPPFIGENPLEVLQKVARSSPQRPRRLMQTIPRTLEVICLRCLERKPLHRYASALDLANDLKLWLEGRKIVRPSLGIRLWRKALEHPAIYTLCAVLLIVLPIICVSQTTIPPPRSLERMTSIAVAVENFDRDPSLQDTARHATSALEGVLSKAATFHLLHNNAADARSLSEQGNPLIWGRAIDAQVVLAGSLRTANHQVRFVTRLLRCDSGEVVWRYTMVVPKDQASSRIPAAAAGIVEKIQARFCNTSAAFSHAANRVPAPDAFAFYTRAKELAARKTPRELNAAVDLLKQSLRADSYFVAARSMLAYTLWVQADGFGELDKLPLAMAAARESLALDPDSAQAHRVIASGFLKDARYSQALEEFWTAVEIDPLSAGCCQSLGVCLRRSGRPDQAIPWLRRAVFLEPAHASTSGTLGEALSLCGRDDEAQAVYEHAIDLDRDQPELQIDLSTLKAWQRKFDEARRLCDQVRDRFPETRYGLSLAAWIDFCDGKFADAEMSFEKLRDERSYPQNWIFYGSINPSSALAFVASRSGLKTRAQSLAQEAMGIDHEILRKTPQNARILHDLAATYSVIGDAKGALSYLRESVAAGWGEGRSTEIDPRFSTLAGLPEFKELLKKACPPPTEN